MPVQAQGPPIAVEVRLDAEDLPAAGVEDALVDQLVDRAAGLERRVELDQRLGPEQTRVEFRLHLGVDHRVADLDEAADVGGVGGEQFLAQLEDVHGPFPGSWAVTGTPV